MATLHEGLIEDDEEDLLALFASDDEGEDKKAPAPAVATRTASAPTVSKPTLTPAATPSKKADPLEDDLLAMFEDDDDDGPMIKSVQPQQVTVPVSQPVASASSVPRPPQPAPVPRKKEQPRPKTGTLEPALKKIRASKIGNIPKPSISKSSTPASIPSAGLGKRNIIIDLDDSPINNNGVVAEIPEVKETAVAPFPEKPTVLDVLNRNIDEGRTRLKAKSTGGVLRPRSAYALFCQAQYQDGFKGQLKLLHLKWKDLDEAEKDIYFEKAARDRERFQEEIKTYFGEKGQDMMSILVQCQTDNGEKRRRRGNEDPLESTRAERHAAAQEQVNLLSGGDDILGDLFGGSGGMDAPPAVAPGGVPLPEFHAPQLRLDANGNIMLDQSTLHVQQGGMFRGPTTASQNARPFENAYKLTKRIKWTEEEDQKFWRAIAAYGSDLMLIQTLFRDKTTKQIKAKFKQEEARNRQKMDDYLFGDKKQPFSRKMFEEQFGKIDPSKHFKPSPEWEKIDIPAPVKEKELNFGTSSAEPAAPAASDVNALLDLFE